MNSALRLIRPAASILAMIAGGALLSSCAGLAVGGNRDILVQDMYEVKKNLNEFIKTQAETDRKTTYQLGALDENVQKNGQISKDAIDELQTRLREQNEELTAIKARLDELKFALEAAGRRGTTTGSTFTSPATGGTAAATGSEGFDPYSGGGEMNATDPGTAAATTGGNLDQLLATARQQVLLGNYAAARPALDSAIALSPEGDQKVETYFYLAETQYNTGDLQGAAGNYMTAIRANNSHEKAWIGLERLADIEAKRGNTQQAISMLDQIVKNKADSYPNIDRVRRTLEELRGSAGQ